MKHLKKIFIFLLIISFTTIIYAAPKSGPLCKQHTCQYLAQYNSIHDKMKAGMINAPITGNATEDFLYEMIPHHEAAIQMSKNILIYTNNSDIKNMAKNIITEQTEGIQKMTLLLKQVQKDTFLLKDHNEEYIQNYKQILATMLNAMDKKPTSSDINVMFLEEMIPHHQGAIAMANNILKYTTNPKLKKIASQIVATQTSQLPEMENLIVKLNQ